MPAEPGTSSSAALPGRRRDPSGSPEGHDGPLAGLADALPGSGRLARPVRDGIALGVSVGVSGLAFGAAAVSSGLSAWQASALSLLAFTGASQYALAGAIAAGGGLLTGTASAILLGSRNALYGLRLAEVLQLRGPVKPLAALGVIDETTALTLAQPDQPAARRGFTATFVTLYLTWNLATLAGALGAGHVGSPQAFGLGVVGPAAFVALIWPRLKAGRTERAVALGGVAIALAATPWLPAGVPVILAAIAALAGALASPAAAPAGGRS
jgi:predicted branched-subunit amino acid permease